ncbi:hypothetical protein ACFSW8_07480 [Rubritalea tangerina]|uniref:Uncharacterized protein n=2 Tax=Rubritalea tangerina TaxID=430798 RepID=A0ABW4ZA40_9BACT
MRMEDALDDDGSSIVIYRVEDLKKLMEWLNNFTLTVDKSFMAPSNEYYIPLLVRRVENKGYEKMYDRYDSSKNIHITLTLVGAEKFNYKNTNESTYFLEIKIVDLN